MNQIWGGPLQVSQGPPHARAADPDAAGSNTADPNAADPDADNADAAEHDAQILS